MNRLLRRYKVNEIFILAISILSLSSAIAEQSAVVINLGDNFIVIPFNPSGAGSTPVVQINCGSGTASGPYAADQYYSGGSLGVSTNTVDTSKVSNPAPMAVYQTTRWDDNTYTIPGLSAGNQYIVRLHFAETYHDEVNERIFNVKINGAPPLTAFDIIAAAGGPNIAVVREFSTTANNNGEIVIEFINAGPDEPKCNGIEILTMEETDREDSDGDGMPDGWEIDNGLNPGVNDADGDPDGDGVSNIDEYTTGTDPNKRQSAEDGAYLFEYDNNGNLTGVQ